MGGSRVATQLLSPAPTFCMRYNCAWLDVHACMQSIGPWSATARRAPLADAENLSSPDQPVNQSRGCRKSEQWKSLSGAGVEVDDVDVVEVEFEVGFLARRSVPRSPSRRIVAPDVRHPSNNTRIVGLHRRLYRRTLLGHILDVPLRVVRTPNVCWSLTLPCSSSSPKSDHASLQPRPTLCLSVCSGPSMHTQPERCARCLRT
jgi:hypothetical protein